MFEMSLSATASVFCVGQLFAFIINGFGMITYFKIDLSHMREYMCVDVGVNVNEWTNGYNCNNKMR